MICDLLALRPISHITQKTLSFPHCTKIEQITKTMVILKQAPLFFAAFAAIQYYHKLPPSGWRILAKLPLVVRALWFGQHSLTSGERPSHLRSDFVNVWRHARLVVSPMTACKLHFDRPLWSVWWSDVCFEVLSCFFDHPTIDSTKKMPLHLFGKGVLMFRLDQAS